MVSSDIIRIITNEAIERDPELCRRFSDMTNLAIPIAEKHDVQIRKFWLTCMMGDFESDGWDRGDLGLTLHIFLLRNEDEPYKIFSKRLWSFHEEYVDELEKIVPMHFPCDYDRLDVLTH